MAVKASVDTQNQTTVRVGQQNAIRVSSTSPAITSADTATTAINVVGGRADVTQLEVSGLSTFTGIGTFVSDLYVGGDLYLTDDLVLDNISGSSLDISGISSVGFITATSLYVSGVSTFAGTLDANGDVDLGASASNTITFHGDVDSAIIPNADNIRALGANGERWSTLWVNQNNSSLLSVTGISTFAGITTVTGDTLFTKQLSVSGLSTYIGVATYKDDVFIDGTLTAGAIDGGTY